MKKGVPHRGLVKVNGTLYLVLERIILIISGAFGTSPSHKKINHGVARLLHELCCRPVNHCVAHGSMADAQNWFKTSRLSTWTSNVTLTGESPSGNLGRSGLEDLSTKYRQMPPQLPHLQMQKWAQEYG